MTTKNKHIIHANYIKDISFEIPSAEVYLMLEKEISKYNLTFDVNNKKLKKNYIEVNTVLKLVAKEEVKKKMHIEISMCSLVSIEEDIADIKELEKIILVKVPRAIYPHLRETVSFLFSKSGLKDLNIPEKVDFEKLYNDRKSNL